MVKTNMDIRVKAVLLYDEKLKSAKEIVSMYNISERTLRRWKKAYAENGYDGLEPKPTIPKKFYNKISEKIEQKILTLKQKHPSWGARRIKHQYDLPASERTVHRVIKKHSLLVRIKPKPQPCKRFQRKHVDSMWQGDTFEFRIKNVGKVYVTGFSDDCSRYRVVSKVYLHKSRKESVNALQWALRKGRVPREIYLDNGKQFIAKDFKSEAKKFGIKLIYGRPYHPRGRGKIEAYHQALYQELICSVKFKSLSHFKNELRNFDLKYNHWRKQEVHGWKTPSSIYNNKMHFNKNRKIIIVSKSGQMFCQQKRP